MLATGEVPPKRRHLDPNSRCLSFQWYVVPEASWVNRRGHFRNWRNPQSDNTSLNLLNDEVKYLCSRKKLRLSNIHGCDRFCMGLSKLVLSMWTDCERGQWENKWKGDVGDCGNSRARSGLEESALSFGQGRWKTKMDDGLDHDSSPEIVYLWYELCTPWDSPFTSTSQRRRRWHISSYNPLQLPPNRPFPS